ncbi:HNH endonuclease family protein [Leucobacter sp. cx-169]|uniref:HNH endonuclease family protein n=1 Tax=Leucobacter sp. cx-169 TaxID=2770549 RepID=UPI00165E2161|nr:HNH endonuclease family protein [Leucobacter sp. cx-169]MBC9927332.1 HNH endonuclease [Leucobacter sp. cx-169]
MKRISSLFIAVVVLGLFASLYIQQGKWDASVLGPIRAVAGDEAAAKVDEGVRGGLAATDEFVAEAGASTVPDLVAKLGTFTAPEVGRMPKYEREQFGDGWLSNVGDGCSTREAILMRDLTEVTMREDRKCKVHTGVLNPDPYTGKVIKFNSVEDPMAVQIDHVVPLSEAWKKGAWEWDPNLRVQFANDPLNLIASDGPENNRKSDKSPSRWMPKNKAFTCEYAERYVQITDKYALSMDPADADTLGRVLEQC